MNCSIKQLLHTNRDRDRGSCRTIRGEWVCRECLAKAETVEKREMETYTVGEGNKLYSVRGEEANSRKIA